MTSNASVASPKVSEAEREVSNLLDQFTRQRLRLPDSFVPIWERFIEYRREKQWNDHYSRKGWDVNEERTKEEKLGLELAQAYLTWRDSQGRN